MPINTTDVFEGFGELIQRPFEQADPRSFALIKKLLLNSRPDHPSPFSFLIEALSGITISHREARNHWKKIIEHKRRLEIKLSRMVNIKTAAIDYYDQLGIDVQAQGEFAPAERAETPPHFIRSSGKRPEGILTSKEHGAPRGGSGSKDLPFSQTAKVIEAKQPGKFDNGGDPLLERINLPGYHQERLKEEMMRARRYKHALSVIMVRVDLRAMDNSPITDETKDKALGIIVKMINKTVRTVDILARHSDNFYVLILPNTNKREALELAERLKTNISQRAHRIPELQGGIPITFAVGQCSKDDTSTDFIKRLENLAGSGNPTVTSAVHALD
jgi:diguanylate cyclase (GGDEF)-like protein